MHSIFNDFLTHKGLLTDDQKEQIRPYYTYKNYAKGETILYKGTVCEHSFFVEKGLLRFYSIDKQGKEHIVQFAPEGWIISDRSSLYFNEASEYYIDAIEDSIVVKIDSKLFSTASNLNIEFSKMNEIKLQKHIRQMQNRINMLLGANASERYLDFMATYPNISARVPQWMIASYLGITPESLSRVRKDLANSI